MTPAAVTAIAVAAAARMVVGVVLVGSMAASGRSTLAVGAGVCVSLQCVVLVLAGVPARRLVRGYRAVRKGGTRVSRRRALGAGAANGGAALPKRNRRVVAEADDRRCTLVIPGWESKVKPPPEAHGRSRLSGVTSSRWTSSRVGKGSPKGGRRATLQAESALLSSSGGSVARFGSEAGFIATLRGVLWVLAPNALVVGVVGVVCRRHHCLAAACACARGVSAAVGGSRLQPQGAAGAAVRP